MYQQLIFGDKYISKDFLTNCFQEVIDEYSDAILRLSKSTAFGPILEEHSFKFDVNYFCMFPKQMKTICLDAGNLVNGESDLQNRVNYFIREIDTNSYLIRYIDIRVRNPKDVKTFINTEEYEKYLDVIDEHSIVVTHKIKSDGYLDGYVYNEVKFEMFVNYFCLHPKTHTLFCLNDGFGYHSGPKGIESINADSYLVRFMEIKINKPKTIMMMNDSDDCFLNDINFCLKRLPSNFKIISGQINKFTYTNYHSVVIRSDIQAVSPNIVSSLKIISSTW